MEILKKLVLRRQFVKLAGWVVATLAIGKKNGSGWVGRPAGNRLRITRTPEGRVADVIVIGAGIFGCSVAWHLRGHGVKVLVIEEASTPAARTTQGAAGFVAHWSAFHATKWKKPEWQMQDYGINFYTQLAENFGYDFGLSKCGASWVFFHLQGEERTSPSSIPDPIQDHRKLLERMEEARQLGTNIEVLGKQQAEKILPLINFDSTEQVFFSPDAVGVWPGEAARSVAKELVQREVQFKYNTSVIGFIRKSDRVVGVKTSAGNYHAPTVIVTAGAWSSPLLKKAGASCPTRVNPDTRYTTKPIPGVPPNMPVLLMNGSYHNYIREWHGGLLIGGHGPITDRTALLSQAQRVREYIRQLEHVMPILKNAEIDQVTPCFATGTSDGRFIADAVPGYPGMYVITGCHEAGITHGPGLGRMMAELVVEGKTTWDRRPFQLDRF